MIVGRLWLSLAAREVNLFVERVESAANIADGPTRHSAEHLHELGARWVAPVWPELVNDIWTPDVYVG